MSSSLLCLSSGFLMQDYEAVVSSLHKPGRTGTAGELALPEQQQLDAQQRGHYSTEHQAVVAYQNYQEQLQQYADAQVGVQGHTYRQ